MIKFYLQSVLIFMIIIYSMLQICKEKIKANGWKSEDQQQNGKWSGLFVLSAVPILRAFIIVVILMMSVYTKEQFDAKLEELKKNA